MGRGEKGRGGDRALPPGGFTPCSGLTAAWIHSASPPDTGALTRASKGPREGAGSGADTRRAWPWWAPGLWKHSDVGLTSPVPKSRCSLGLGGQSFVQCFISVPCTDVGNHLVLHLLLTPHPARALLSDATAPPARRCSQGGDGGCEGSRTAGCQPALGLPGHRGPRPCGLWAPVPTRWGPVISAHSVYILRPFTGTQKSGGSPELLHLSSFCPWAPSNNSGFTRYRQQVLTQ